MIHSTQPMNALLKYWENERLITPLDRHFAFELAQLHQVQLRILDECHGTSYSDLFLLICALLSKHLSQQHTCLPIHHIVLNNPMLEQASHCQITLSHDELTAVLAQCPCITTFTSTQANNTLNSTPSPMVLEGGSLYLQRYYQFETQICDFLLRLSNSQCTSGSTATKARLDRLFPPLSHDIQPNIDWQKIATATAFSQKLAVITGGPGTGKTTTVTKLLFLLTLESPMVIRLVAPTGKAAARLSESIKGSKQRLAQELAAFADEMDLSCLQRIPEEASTLHRLLGVIPNSHQFRHHKDNPLRLDLLVVDEASMVDLPMMHKMLSALPAHARLILLGDQDQLASVEAGAVLADICAGLKHSNTLSNDTSTRNNTQWRMRYSADHAQHLFTLTGVDLSEFISDSPQMGDNLCMLMHSHRFQGDAGIGQLASAVNNSDKHRIMHVWQTGYQELNWIEHQKMHTGNTGLDQLLSQAVNHYRGYLELAHNGTSHPSAIIDCYNEFRILCAMRAGEYGVDGINLGVANALKKAKLISTELEFYQGRPVIIQSNDYNLGLFNGDIGLILLDQANTGSDHLTAPRLMAHFIQADGSVLKVLPARLPSHDTCFAMTVHKSQGSEFNNVALVLPLWPSVAQKQLLTKELIYTAITRAKQHFTCLGSQTVFELASLHATQRSSGLARRLWNETI
ncbi:exodeoxyribonuclease V subunit alpha [Shewanella sp. VB17]|uniref:exodeoxyribonuclease V subunit alpha n=1 Tax=Shewanella sp. VB17 TaxID=2739432 RepID=UPI00156543B4|nr:exodeoxyribonuclease V subunit alpha [Shewanella sp. VB17]NRD73878.1 exodeoxyribonuclease V subunit alpha [Shewanella sp. VB17]